MGKICLSFRKRGVGGISTLAWMLTIFTNQRKFRHLSSVAGPPCGLDIVMKDIEFVNRCQASDTVRASSPKFLAGQTGPFGQGLKLGPSYLGVAHSSAQAAVRPGDDVFPAHQAGVFQ